MFLELKKEEERKVPLLLIQFCKEGTRNSRHVKENVTLNDIAGLFTFYTTCYTITIACYMVLNLQITQYYMDIKFLKTLNMLDKSVWLNVTRYHIEWLWWCRWNVSNISIADEAEFLLNIKGIQIHEKKKGKIPRFT